MARYIDADAFLERMKKTPRYFDVKFDIEQEPTADVVPKSDVDRLEYTLLGVMHSVDKWLEGDELEQDEVNRAATMREKILQIIENAKTEVAREIFEEIGVIFSEHYGKASEPTDLMLLEPLRQAERFVINEMWEEIAELEKKYTEGKE